MVYYETPHTNGACPSWSRCYGICHACLVHGPDIHTRAYVNKGQIRVFRCCMEVGGSALRWSALCWSALCCFSPFVEPLNQTLSAGLSWVSSTCRAVNSIVVYTLIYIPPTYKCRHYCLDDCDCALLAHWVFRDDLFGVNRPWNKTVFFTLKDSTLHR